MTADRRTHHAVTAIGGLVVGVTVAVYTGILQGALVNAVNAVGAAI